MRNALIAMLCCLPLVSIAQEPITVVVEAVTTDSVQRQLQLTGSVKAPRHAQLSTLADGVVTSVYAEAGDFVEQGDRLLTLDPELAKAEAAASAAELSRSEYALAEAQRKADEAKTLSQREFVSKTELQERQSLVAIAKASRNKAKADDDYQQQWLQRHILTAPFSGVIAHRLVNIGEWISRGDSVFELVSQQPLWVEFAVPQEHFADINIQQSVPLVFGSGQQSNSDEDSVPHQGAEENLTQQTSYLGTVLTKVPVFDSQSRSFLLRVALDEPQLSQSGAQVGMSATAHVPLSSGGRTTIFVSADALLRQPDGGYSVFVIADNKAQRRSVKVGERANHKRQILQGLVAGEQVVVEGNERLQEGQTVKVQSSGDQ